MTDASPSSTPPTPPSPPPSAAASRADQAMEDASVALVERKYFLAERLCADALRTAIAADDYERAGRICMPLLEARRLKRQQAIDAGRIVIINEPVTEGMEIKAGCYIVCPPRVGAEARTIRQMADQAEVPVIVIAREPATRAGLCPVVAVGPITVRAFVPEPPPVDPARPGKPRKGPKVPDPAPPSPPSPSGVFGAFAPPPIEWVLSTCEALGDAAIAQAAATTASDLVNELHARLQSCPDHEKLHQRLVDACERAAREPRRRKPAPAAPAEFDEFGEGSFSSEE